MEGSRMDGRKRAEGGVADALERGGVEGSAGRQVRGANMWEGRAGGGGRKEMNR